MRKKVFLGSTAYDLADVRAELDVFLRGLGYDILSFESADFPVISSLHSHDVCLNAIKHCDVYILIINRRYGGTYAGSLYPEFTGLSITHAEARFAFQLNKKVYTFVRQAVWDERATYKTNLKSGTNIKLFHVESPRVLELVDEVLSRHADNWIYFVDTFHNSVALKQQVSAMLMSEEQRTALAKRSEHGETTPNIAGFLQALGLQHSIGQNSDRYFSLPTVFVPPSEYPRIRQLLNIKNFVLILGDPLIGKTYTALHLLYEYFCDGYFPIWESVRDIEITSDPLFSALRRPRFDVEEYVSSHLTARNAIYIEDPWGKIEFSLPEEFTGSLNSIIDRVAASPAKLIITSRTTIFNRLTDLLGKDFVVTLRTEMKYGQPNSYNLAMRRELLARYANLFALEKRIDSRVVSKVISTLYAPSSIREFCHRIKNTPDTQGVLQAISYSSDLKQQFSAELVRESRPNPAGRPHRAILALMVYAIERSDYFWRADSAGGMRFLNLSKRTFAALFKRAVAGLPSIPSDPLQDAIESFSGRIISRTVSDRYARIRRMKTYLFAHPIYSEGVRGAIKDSNVRRLMATVVIALGEEFKCNVCGYEGPFVSTYRFNCHELNPEGPVCIKCHTWGDCSYVLSGVSLASALHNLYRELGIVRIFRVAIGSEQIDLSILGTHCDRFTVDDLKARLCTEIECITQVKLVAKEFSLRNRGNRVSVNCCLSDLPDDEWIFVFHKNSKMNVKSLAEQIRKESTNINW